MTHPNSTHQKVTASLRRRRRLEKLFKGLGLGSVALSLTLVAVLFLSIFSKGLPAFWQTSLDVEVYFDPDVINISPKPQRQKGESAQEFDDRLQDWETELGLVNFNRLISAAIIPHLDEYQPSQSRFVTRLITSGERHALRQRVMEDPSIIGERRRLRFLTDANVDVWIKGNIDRDLPDAQQQLPPQVRTWADELYDKGIIKNRFSTALFMNTDSRSSLASAGLAGAFVGSLYMMLIVILLAVPTGVLAAIYLEEFAAKNKLTDVIEVNINNLAAVPSIIFGLLGAAVFINTFKLPMSAPIVGGLVLSLMTLPTVIIATRATLRAVPPSIRDAALGLGASRTQTVFHHVLPLAVPGILTGAILGVAQALGETAPLLLIGMQSFVASVADTPFDQSTALPVQIYLWQGNELRNFFEARTSAAIIVLLMLMISLNALAIWLRRKLEVRW